MYDAVVVGGGAAGLMAAGVAARSGKKVLLLEKMEKAARKVRITGKGRCNLTNVCPREVFLSKVRSGAEFFGQAFAEFDNDALIAFFRDEGVRIKVERGGRAFPESEKAWDIAQALIDYATEGGVEIAYYTSAVRLRTIAGRVNGVVMRNRRGFERVVESPAVIVCTGGASYPATGSTGDGYALAHALGHRIEEVRPALVPLVSRSRLAEELKGLKLKNVNVSLVVEGETVASEFGEMEFGSRGIEGAIILKLSRPAVDAIIDEKEVAIRIDLKPALTPEVIAERIEREITAMTDSEGIADTGFGPPDVSAARLLRKLMPKPMIAPFAKELGIGLRLPAERIDEEQKERIIGQLKGLLIPVDDYGSFETAVVTAGGVALDEVDPATMQSKLVRGLYFAGEVLDIDADTGGYNLQVAFSTGHMAGKLKG